MKRTITSTLLSLLALCSVASIELTQPATAKKKDPGISTSDARYTPAVQDADLNRSYMMEPKNVPDFAPETDSGPSTPLRADVGATTVPVATRLRLVLETLVDAKTSQPGDIFEAHVKDDLVVGTSLLLPRGSLIRGRVYEVTRPRLLSRAGRISLKLDQIATPLGEVIPLDAALEFRKGMTNQKGELDPGTSLGSRVGSSVKTVTGLNSSGTARGALVAANVATLGAPAVATLIGSSTIGIFRSGDNVCLEPGQELEVLLTNDLGIQL